MDKPVPLNNHIYVAGQEGYQDNSIGFDPDAAKRDLDALGWRMNGPFREKDGRRLTIRDVFYDAQSTGQIGQIAQNNLAQIGVDLQLVPVAGGKLFSDFVTPGNFDVVQFAWGGDAFPLSGLTQIYASTGESNYGKIGTPEIDAKIEQTLSELDQAKRARWPTRSTSCCGRRSSACRCSRPRATWRCAARWPTSARPASAT